MRDPNASTVGKQSVNDVCEYVSADVRINSRQRVVK
jgi:hypothetical protein